MVLDDFFLVVKVVVAVQRNVDSVLESGEGRVYCVVI
jgi:hypothetical protein